jgi:putative ABC transport system permease protein
MFGRLLWKLLRGNRGRLAVALVAMASGAAVISALFNMQFDVREKMTQEFRSLGANLVISRVGEGERALASEEAMASLAQNLAPAGTIAAPYLYIVARTESGRPVVVAGTHLDLAMQLNPTWRVRGAENGLADNAAACFAGIHAAEAMKLQRGGSVKFKVGENAMSCKLAGVITSGGDEDDQVFAQLVAVQKLAGLPGQISLTQARVPGSAKEIQELADRIDALPGNLRARPIRQISETEGALLGRVRLLIVSMAVLIFVLTALSVLATMTALAMERRADVGLMKALGGSIGRIVALFLAEVSVLGVAGGVVGYLIGALLTIWIGRSVFGAAIAPRVEVLPLIVALMVGVALAGALPLRLLGRVKPAVILRGE